MIKSYHQIINLDYSIAKKYLISNAIPNNNKAKILLDNYNDFFRLFIHENRTFYNKVKSNKSDRLQIIEKSNCSPEWKNFLQAEIHLQWALVHLKMEDNIDALQSIRQALKLLELNVNDHPEFMYSYKSLGILHVILSTIPDNFSWAAKLIGLKGTLLQGISELDQFIAFAKKNNLVLLDEAICAKAFIISYLENKPIQAYNYLSDHLSHTDPNPLMAFIHARIALKAGYNESVINAINSLPLESKNKLPFLEYLIGMALLQKLDPAADLHFINYVTNFRGQSYIKEAYQKLSWHAIINNNDSKYIKYKNLCLSRGNTLTDEDKQAMSEASQNIKANTHLLQARLLHDGHYGFRAEKILLENKNTILQESKNTLEYYYRLGRIYQLLNKNDLALITFQQAITSDPNHHSFMTCNALLQCGLIYENKKEFTKAKYYFNQTLNSKPDQYARSLKQKSKAALNRIK